MLGQTGEYLVLSTQTLTPKPVLAESWSPNSTADVWTFKIRQNVKFHNGQPLTADDVVYTFKLLTNPKAANPTLAGVLVPSGVQKVDDHTVAFHLEAPNGNFPYLVSSDNYNTIIIPNNYDPAKWQSSFIGTGPFKLKSYTEKQGASFVRNDSYWGPKAKPAATEFTFYDTETPLTLALTGGSIDVVGQFSVSTSPQLLNGQYNVVKLKSSAHRELSMRNDQAPFTDPRVRRAIALSLDRTAIVKSLFKGNADVGNDSPFAPVFPSTDTSIAQRAMNISQAKSLLAAAGHGSGFSTQLLANQQQEIPQYAQIIVESAKADRRQHQPEGGAVVGLLRQGHVRELRLAGRHDEPGRLRPPQRAERVPDQPAGDHQRQDRRRGLERGQVQQRAVRQAGRAVRRLLGSAEPAPDRRPDRDPAARPDPDRLRLLLQLPVGLGQERDGIYPTAIGHIFLYNTTKS